MDEVEEFRYLVLAAQRDGQRLLGEALRPLGLTTAGAEVLALLRQPATLSLRELGGRLVCEAGSPSRLVDGLVRAGWVQRRAAPDDARRSELSLTPDGRALAERVAAIEAEFGGELADLLAGVPLQTINAALWRLVAHLPSGKALRRRLAEEG